MVKSVSRIPYFCFWIVLSCAILKPLDLLTAPSAETFHALSYLSLDSDDLDLSITDAIRLTYPQQLRHTASLLISVFLLSPIDLAHPVRAPPYAVKV